MKISIITATYNSAAHIAGCLASVNSQTSHTMTQSHGMTNSGQNLRKNNTTQASFEIEHIIVDGASTDNTLEIIKSTPNRITQLISEPDNGIYDALNKGLYLATGDIIGFLHADDTYASKNTIQSISSIFSNKMVDGVYGDLLYVNNDGEIIRNWVSKPFKMKYLYYGWMPPHPTLFLKKEVYNKFGNFDINLKIAADYDFILRIFKEKNLNIIYIPQIITKMRIGGTSNKSVKNIIKKSKEDLIAIRKNKIGGIYTLYCKNFQKLPQFFYIKNREL